MDPLYPSTLKFWIRLLDVPLQFWADPTFQSIGQALGNVEEVDSDGGRVPRSTTSSLSVLRHKLSLVMEK